jgi:hypothetical protein
MALKVLIPGRRASATIPYEQARSVVADILSLIARPDHTILLTANESALRQRLSARTVVIDDAYLAFVRDAERTMTEAVAGGFDAFVLDTSSLSALEVADLALIIHRGWWPPRSVPRIAATAEILGSRYDKSPAGGPGAGGFHVPQGPFRKSLGRIRAGQLRSGRALIRCQARVIASVQGQLAGNFQRRRRPPRTRRAAACRTR